MCLVKKNNKKFTFPKNLKWKQIHFGLDIFGHWIIPVIVWSMDWWIGCFFFYLWSYFDLNFRFNFLLLHNHHKNFTDYWFYWFYWFIGLDFKSRKKIVTIQMNGLFGNFIPGKKNHQTHTHAQWIFFFSLCYTVVLQRWSWCWSFFFILQESHSLFLLLCLCDHHRYRSLYSNRFVFCILAFFSISQYFRYVWWG